MRKVSKSKVLHAIGPQKVAKRKKGRKISGNDSDKSSAESERIQSHAILGQATRGSKTNLLIDEHKNEATKEGDVGDDVNIKRSIEMKNGIALRSMNNFHKGTNAISLNNYRVSSSYFNSKFNLDY